MTGIKEVSGFFDIDRNPISCKDWVASLSNTERKTIKQDFVFINGNHTHSVLTVSLDLVRIVTPVFETMVLFKEGGQCWQFSTKEQAIAAQEKIVAQLEAGVLPKDVEIDIPFVFKGEHAIPAPALS